MNAPLELVKRWQVMSVDVGVKRSWSTLALAKDDRDEIEARSPNAIVNIEEVLVPAEPEPGPTARTEDGNTHTDLCNGLNCPCYREGIGWELIRFLKKGPAEPDTRATHVPAAWVGKEEQWWHHVENCRDCSRMRRRPRPGEINAHQAHLEPDPNCPMCEPRGH